MALLCVLFVCPRAYCQWNHHPTTGSPENRLPDLTTMAGQSGLGPVMTAKLVDQEQNAKHHRAVIQIETDGVRLVDAASADHQPRLDEGHIRYRVDNGPEQNSTSKTITLENLPSGTRLIHVDLMDSTEAKMGRSTTLKVEIP